ncbi:hydroxyethylthiazole kinase [Oscillibacter sp.]|uniref:hydroxyethylthiazole kinase n=1 Tax=Oscillibacter sp. TaxID=1945593 RepID=UPI002625B2BE|nr:hydroxyethylthiazole kinase [Oscillibacter sp.]MDD3346126.1 hydroxyethylthiazole kinase [Oscillibacter sp.]
MMDFTRLDALRQRRPLLHCVSNLVSANDCANLALAVGASPIMAQGEGEMAAVTAASSATVLNTGTPDEEKYRVCLLCSQAAAALAQPVVLDPVGVGANLWRLQHVQALLQCFTPSILRVNLGEAQALVQTTGCGQGVDSPAPATAQERQSAAVTLARQYQTTVLLSGPEDVVTDGETVWQVDGGSNLMAYVTGTGCMLSVLCGAFAAVTPKTLEAAVLAAAFWKVCSRRAEIAADSRGPGSFRAALFDAAYALTAQDFAKEAAASLTKR